MAGLLDRAALLLLLQHSGTEAADLDAARLEASGSGLARLHELNAGQQSLLLDDELRRAADAIARWEAQGIELVSIFDEKYPLNLRSAEDRPPLIFVAGELRPADSHSLAVIGSRLASGEGVRLARATATHLAESGYTVFSGLAAGIDAAAHTAALDVAQRTVAVTGTGLERCYPPQHAALQARIAREGAVISQFLPDAPPTSASFPKRNAVMSGMTLATVVVEASFRSGARIQCRLALAQGRLVFLSRLTLREEWAREMTTRPGVYTFGEPEEITETLGLQVGHSRR